MLNLNEDESERSQTNHQNQPVNLKIQVSLVEMTALVLKLGKLLLMKTLLIACIHSVWKWTLLMKKTLNSKPRKVDPHYSPNKIHWMILKNERFTLSKSQKSCKIWSNKPNLSLLNSILESKDLKQLLILMKRNEFSWLWLYLMIHHEL